MINTKNLPSIDWSKLSSAKGSIVMFLYVVLTAIIIAICVLVFRNSRFRSISTIQKAIFTSTFIFIFGVVIISQNKDKKFSGISTMRKMFSGVFSSPTGEQTRKNDKVASKDNGPGLGL